MEATLAPYFSSSATPAQQTAVIESVLGHLSSSSSGGIVDVVASLGPIATSSDPFERAKAVALLSALLQRGAANDGKTVRVLLDFFLARLQDQTSVPELLVGIQAMLKSGFVGRPGALDIARALFKEINVQNYAQTVRFSVYCIFEALLKSHLDAMKYLGDAFISGFLVAMDGEKDPRNILISFSIIQSIIVNFDITRKHDDVFESIYCYFPITFRPPPNDPYGITSADLKLKLRNCFSASPLFGKLAWPILIEKLASTSDNAKLDAMETIAACAPVYGGSSIGKNLEELWEQLREESLDVKPSPQREAALSAITAVTYALSTDASASSTSRDALTKFLGNVEKYVLGELIDTHTPKESARRVLKAAAKSTEPAFFYLVSHIMKPFLDGLKAGSESMESRAEKYGVFCDFLEIAQEFYGNETSMDEDSLPSNPLLPFKDDLYAYFSSALSSKNNRVVIAGLHGLSQLSIQRGHGFMTERELEWYFETLLGLVINENNTIRQAVIELLIVESNRRVEKVLFHIVPQLVEASSIGKEEPVLNSLECLVALCGASGAVLCAVVPKLTLLTQELKSIALIRQLVTALEVIFAEQTQIVSSLNYHNSLFEPVLSTLIGRQVDGRWLYSDLFLVESAARTFSSVVRLMDRSDQEEAAKLVVKSLYFGDLTGLGISGTVSVNAHSESRLLSIVLAAVICNLRTDASVPNVDIGSMINNLTQEAVFKASENIPDVYSNSLFEIIASVLNKGDAELISGFLKSNAALYKVVQSEESCPVKTRNAAVTLVLWVTRASVMKKPSTDELTRVSGLIQLLKSSKGDIVASNFNLLSADDPSFGKHVLTKESFAKSSLLWKQKLFKHCLPILVDGFSNSTEDLKSNYLLALSHLMKYVSKSVILYEIQNLIPLLLAGLSSKNNQLNLTILEIVQTLLTDAPTALQAHLQSFVTALLRLVGGTDVVSREVAKQNMSTSPEVRVLALKCLGNIPKTELPFNELFVMKPRVIRGLQVALDDEKKNVRKEAGNARAKWYLLLGGK